MTVTAHSEFGSIKQIILKHPAQAFVDQKKIDSQWQQLNYFSKPDFEKAVEDYEIFARLIKASASDKIEIISLPSDAGTSIDSIYVRDAMITTDGGVILCNMGKAERMGEPEAARLYLDELQLPILGRIGGGGRIEGGDFIWLDQKTAVIGIGYRTNFEGVKQFQELTADIVEEVITVPLPHWNGPDDVFHLMSIISPLDHNLAAVYSRLMPVTFRNLLLERGIELVEIPDDEFDSMGCNILALAPRKCLMLEGNPITRQRLEQAGVEVISYDGSEISLKGAGGPTCLTRPILREV